MPTETKSLEDIFDEYMMATDRPTRESLEHFSSRYPDRVNELRDFAAEWLVLANIDENQDLVTDANDAAVSTAISDLQNRLYELDQNTPERGIDSLFDGLSPAQFHDAAHTLNVRGPFLAKVRYRLVSPSTIPEQFVASLAAVLNASLEQMSQYLRLDPEMPIANFKTNDKPRIPNQQSFAEALRSVGASDSEIDGWTKESD